MAVTSQVVRVSYAGNNSTVTPYVIPFQYLAPTDVVVVVRTSAGVETTLALTTDYVIAGTGYPTAGGSFTTLVAVAVTSTVVVFRRTDTTQTTGYIETDEFPAASHERALDKITFLSQERKDVDERSFRLTNRSTTIGEITPVLDSLLGLDPAGVPWMLTSSDVLAWVNLVQTLGNFPTKTWLNAAARATAVPDFIGQVGAQRDTMVLYLGTALSAGSWVAAVSSVADDAITTAKILAGALAATATGRAKMADAFITLAKLSTDVMTALTPKTLLADADTLFGYSAADAAFRSFAGNVAVPPGSVIQVQIGTYAANADITGIMPTFDIIPDITQGTQIISLPFTPRFADSKILFMFSGMACQTTVNDVCAALFRNSVSAAIGSVAQVVSPTAGFRDILTFYCEDTPGAGAHTYTVRAGPNGASTIRFNGSTTTRMHGGAMKATLIAMELKV